MNEPAFQLQRAALYLALTRLEPDAEVRDMFTELHAAMSDDLASEAVEQACHAVLDAINAKGCRL